MLEKKITSTLADANISSADLTTLIEETEAAITIADDTAKTELQKALDPMLSPDLKAARAAMEDAEFAATRLRTLLPRLQQRLLEVQAAENAAHWDADFQKVAAKRDAAAKEFTRYPELVAELCDMFHEAAAVDKECSEVNGSAPLGEYRRLLGVELTARGLENFSISNPSLAKSIQLPDWNSSEQNVWPPPQRIDPAFFAPHPYDPRYTDHWWEVAEERHRRDDGQQRRESAAAEFAKKEFYAGR